jgi:hypothetical protein
MGLMRGEENSEFPRENSQVALLKRSTLETITKQKTQSTMGGAER